MIDYVMFTRSAAGRDCLAIERRLWVKRTTYSLLLAATALLILALSACVRPAPGTENLP